MRKWDELPKFMRTDEVKQYYDILIRHEKELRLKRYFDILLSMILLVILSPIMLVISIAIKLDSPGPVIYKQVRVTQYGKKFHILKFRTMVQNADKMGTQVTISQDSRLTRVGKVIRGCRIDEFPQLINVLRGEMSFVGTRPEVVKYVKGYTKEMYATLLLPAGITSRASVCYNDEGEMLEHVEDVDYAYIHEVLFIRYLKCSTFPAAYAHILASRRIISFMDISFSHLSLLIFFGFLLYSAGIMESPSSSQYLFVIGWR